MVEAKKKKYALKSNASVSSVLRYLLPFRDMCGRSWVYDGGIHNRLAFNGIDGVVAGPVIMRIV
ncbi:hypothetical protein BDQ94DRAFT_18660 [Aspergillus welwitschiae]|uniref:Uncharacterized protein n=1 Tax=Aspergillus welwitschiae TaxID=1341132 RepID=A0A3F3Q5M4_9EURO|nr:hypothetical protein BDQ94DRAFT_18660 [Aspergillus welwitschiae]RDH34347.1 hypothetical protein BDQ94DRAFT_18660 [Aspergillus welwitschiae]